MAKTAGQSPVPPQLGRFTVLAEIGAGGMGRVYRAHDPTLRREVAAAGYTHGRAGHRREALAALKELNDLDASRARYVSPYARALVHIGLDNRDEAFRWLQQAVDERHPIAVFLAVEPDLDPLRSDARFAELLVRARR